MLPLRVVKPSSIISQLRALKSPLKPFQRFQSQLHTFQTPFARSVPTLSKVRPARQKLNLKWSIPFLLGSSLVYGSSPGFIANDALQVNAPTIQRKSIFGKSVSYEELTLGSISGLFFGVIIGKLSSVIALASLGMYFFLQFLETRGIITIPWNSIITVGKETFDVKNLVMNKTGFKLCFVLSFVIAAYNI